MGEKEANKKKLNAAHLQAGQILRKLQVTSESLHMSMEKFKKIDHLIGELETHLRQLKADFNRRLKHNGSKVTRICLAQHQDAIRRLKKQIADHKSHLQMEINSSSDQDPLEGNGKIIGQQEQIAKREADMKAINKILYGRRNEIDKSSLEIRSRQQEMQETIEAFSKSSTLLEEHHSDSLDINMEQSRNIDDRIAELEKGLQMQTDFLNNLCSQGWLNGIGLMAHSVNVYAIKRHNEVIKGIEKELNDLRRQKAMEK
ncbi:GL22892 [Drosophila persimilis]|uniref:GL22892 n=1 Tax=Drosophila persimilis TaxID=7234 RepID=B4H000_DROPE|nr:GL22892 [Drosophila persimilis]